MDYRKNPKNVWDPEQTTMGWNGITASLGRWDPDAPVFEEILGQPVCVPDSDPCVGEGMCSGTCINFAGACSWPPEEFGGMVDMWLEIHAQANPTILQHNEVRCTSLLHTYTPPHTAFTDFILPLPLRSLSLSLPTRRRAWRHSLS